MRLKVMFGVLRHQYALTMIAGLSLILAGASVSLAQVFLPNAVEWPGLTQDNLDRMSAAAGRLNEGRSIGTVERWRNPDTKDAGEIKLVRKFDSHGMPCRTLDYIIRFETARNSPTHYVVNWCKVEGDNWKIVELAPPTEWLQDQMARGIRNA
jgi:hypothetical protein